jgi:hypothetical protein
VTTTRPSRPGDPPSRRVAGPSRIRVALVTAVLLCASIAGVALDSGTAQASSCGGPLGDGEIRVVIVVDPGDSGPGGPGATCMVVPAGTTGSQLLARRAAELGAATPRYGGSGLLCAIDGFPSSGCGEHSGGGFAYWAYFNGTGGSWSYGSYNPFIRRISDGDIEGWRFVDGSGSGQDPPPRISPSSSLFPPVAPPPAPVGTASPGGPPPAGAGTGTGVPGAVGVAGVPGAAGSADAAAIDSTTDSSIGESTTSSTVAAAAVGDIALASSRGSDSNAGRWIGVSVIAALVLAFAVGAFVRTRRSA